MKTPSRIFKRTRIFPIGIPSGQYFLGYSSYQFKPCFDPSLFVIPIYREKRLKAREIEAINEVFIARVKELRTKEKEAKHSRKCCGSPKDDNNQSTKSDTNEKKNKGKLIVDATVAPSNIKYPTDLDLLNESREISEHTIDTLYTSGQFSEKPRTYRRLARRDYLRIIKKRRKSKKVIRLGIRQPGRRRAVFTTEFILY